MISIYLKFSVMSFSALWNSVQTHSEQNLWWQKFICITLTEKRMWMGMAVLKTVFSKLRCGKKSNLLNSCVVWGFL